MTRKADNGLIFEGDVKMRNRKIPESGFVDVGNTTSLTTAAATDTQDRVSKRKGSYGQALDSLKTTKPTEIGLKMDTFDKTNLAMALMVEAAELLDFELAAEIRDMVNAETIIGDPIHVDDTTIIPVSRVTFGFVSGGSDVGPSSNKQMFGGGSGAGVSVTPVAFLVVSNGNVRTVQLVEKVSAVDNVIASLPELVDKVAALIKKEKPGADAPAE